MYALASAAAKEREPLPDHDLGLCSHPYATLPPCTRRLQGLILATKASLSEIRCALDQSSDERLFFLCE